MTPASESLFRGFDHVEFYVGNAKLTAEWYAHAFGFEPLAYRGLETGYREGTATHVVRKGDVVFAFTSSLGMDTPLARQVSAHVARHGDGVRDVALRVKDVRAVVERAVAKGARVVHPPRQTDQPDGRGFVVLATVATYGDTLHTLVQRDAYQGAFLPGFEPVDSEAAAAGSRSWAGSDADVELLVIDHVVGNQGWNEMERAANWYRDVFGFHRFWSVDDKMIHTEYSSLRSIVMADATLSVKMPINEPAEGKRPSQIQEFVEFFGGPGVQHLALLTTNAIKTVAELRKRGVHFISVPDAYYEGLHRRLAGAGVKVREDLALIKRFNLLVDFDERGYLIQTFTKPLQDRPTFFLEIIQRNGNQGFGAGNFGALFEASALVWAVGR